MPTTLGPYRLEAELGAGAMGKVYRASGPAGRPSWPVVGGIAGVGKCIYDVFGDTINTASQISQIETSSEPMRINVSEATWRPARGDFAYVERAPGEVMGKAGMRMFSVDA